MNITSNTTFRHSDDNLVSLFWCDSGNTGYIEMTGRFMFIIVMFKRSNAEWLKCSIISINNLFSSRQHSGITFKLFQPYRRRNVGHIALIPCTNNIIFPSAKLCFSKSIFWLTVHAKQLKFVIDILITHAIDYTPCQRSAFSSRKVLDSMKAEARKIRNTANHLSMPFCAKSMSCIGTYSDSAKCLLHIIWLPEHILFTLNNLKNTFIITRHTAEINRDYRLCLFGNCGFHRIIVHLKAVFLRINHYDSCTHMINHRCWCRICICRHDNLITFANTEYAQSHFCTSSLRIEANTSIRTDPFSNLFFKFFCSRASGNPAGAKRICNFAYFGFRNIRKTKRNFFCTFWHLFSSSCFR